MRNLLLAAWLLTSGVVAQGGATGLRLALEVGEQRDVRTARQVAIHVEAGRSPSVFLPAGPFRARWTGILEIGFRDRYTFHQRGNGVLTLSIDGKPVELGQRVRLRKGSRRIDVQYRSPSEGAATMRLLWSGSDFVPEPLPTHDLSHDASETVLVAATERRRGRALLASRQCASCHELPDDVATAGGMPELAQRGPALDRAGERLRAGWMTRWILDPHALRPETNMPAVLRGAEAADEARDLAAYLASRGEPTAIAPGDAAAGRVLYAQLGCVGCHTEPGQPQDATRISLTEVAAKFHPGGLVAFLRKPHEHDPWIEMPDFDLAGEEAAALAAFLVEGRDAPAEGVAGDAARGAELFTARGCASCHDEAAADRPAGPEWTSLDFQNGCTGDDVAGAPDFRFSKRDRLAVRAAAVDVAALSRFVPAEFAERRMTQLRCDACHDRDGRRSLWTERATEVAAYLEGIEPPKLSQSRPSLTWAGEKLRPDWMTALFTGEVPARSRPWLRARMPRFPAAAAELAQGMAAQHGYPVACADRERDPGHVASGEQLIGSAGGFSCILCHAVGEQPPLAVFESQGVDFALVGARLRRDYYLRWMQNPLRIDPSSRMPKYADERGKTAFTDVLGGDAEAQFDAIWQYLRELSAEDR